jgi:uncharacterized protein (DUF2267 family)
MSDFNYQAYLKNNPLLQKEVKEEKLLTESQEVEDSVSEDTRTDAEQEGYKDGFDDAKDDVKDALSKMKVSELKAKIKENILATLSEEDLEEDVMDHEKEERDFIDGDGMEEALDMTASPETLRKMIFQLLDDGHIQSETADDILNAISNSPSKNVYEADEEEDVDVDVEDEVEIDIEEPSVDVDASEAGLSSDEQEIQDSLKLAYDNAVAIGDQKLADQIGNSITFFTRTHVVER